MFFEKQKEYIYIFKYISYKEELAVCLFCCAHKKFHIFDKIM